MSSSVRVADRYLQAGPSEWVQWFVQPMEVIWKHHKDFVYGPVDDAVDAIIKDLAPRVVKVIGEEEVDADVEEFISGALQGKWDVEHGYLADLSRSWSKYFRKGYEWGYENPDEVDSSRGLPSGVKRQVIQDAIKDFRHRITEEVVERALEKAWHAISPTHTLKAIFQAVKKHGWKIGIAAALFELFEHMVLPTVMIALTGHEEMAILGALPLGEIVYAVVLRIIGSVPSEVSKMDEDGHLDWYEARYGPVRIALKLDGSYSVGQTS